ncbi:hypothetical protein [Alkaliphilus pronyensis]|uniref:hypothetical protein n=1 Tax=Alkaliphilus pronyensis TaxID=1482732 RepID=UPI0018656DB9|nr:hypothetical protein [Alkaliphilus pronyensis]
MARRNIKKRNNKTIYERLSNENIMSDGMLEPVNSTTRAILSMVKDAPNYPNNEKH